MFTVKNWTKFQHYKERHPPWIKLYHDLLDDDAFAALDHFSQLLYFKLLMAASRKDNRIPEDIAWMSTELSLPKRRIQKSIDALLASGFLASEPASRRASNGASSVASKTARPSRAPARSRESEPEVETEKPEPVPEPEASYEDQPKLDRNGRGSGTGSDEELTTLEAETAGLLARARDQGPNR